MYYIVVFKENNTVKIVKQSWLQNENETKYPPENFIQYYLQAREGSYDTLTWPLHEITLKCPSRYGEKGLNSLSDAIHKEKFYSRVRDQEEESEEELRPYKNPRVKIENEDEINDVIIQNLQQSYEKYSDDEEQNTEGSDSNFNIEFLDVSSAKKKSASRKKVISKEKRMNPPKDIRNPSTLDIFNICQDILRTVRAIRNRVSTLEKRVDYLEGVVFKDDNLDDFQLEPADCHADFFNMIQKISEDSTYRHKMVCYLNANCTKGNSKYAHNGIVKSILEKVFTQSYKMKVSWASEKNKESFHETRLHLCDYPVFQNLLLDVLNYHNSDQEFTHDHVVKALKETFKRLVRV